MLHLATQKRSNPNRGSSKKIAFCFPTRCGIVENFAIRRRLLAKTLEKHST
jgi:hypothetical protein